MSNNSDKPKIHVTCEVCSQKFSFLVPPIEISNNFQSSCITIPHESLIRCTNSKCRQPYIPVVAISPDWRLSWVMQSVGDEVVERVEGSKLIKSALELVGSH